jgi:hypothetical protein
MGSIGTAVDEVAGAAHCTVLPDTGQQLSGDLWADAEDRAGVRGHLADESGQPPVSNGDLPDRPALRACDAGAWRPSP